METATARELVRREFSTQSALLCAQLLEGRSRQCYTVRDMPYVLLATIFTSVDGDQNGNVLGLRLDDGLDRGV